MTAQWQRTRSCPRCGACFWLALSAPLPPHTAEGRSTPCDAWTTPRPKPLEVLRW